VRCHRRGCDCGEGGVPCSSCGCDPEGAWSVTADEEGHVDLPSAGSDPASFTGALDSDLGLSPVTNLVPILRHDLLSGGGPSKLTMAWVSVPDLSVQADGERYTFVRADQDDRVIRYEATDGTAQEPPRSGRFGSRRGAAPRGSLQLLEPLPQPVDVGAAAGVELAAEANVQAAPADDVGHERVAGREPAAGERKRERPHVHAIARPSVPFGKVALQE
jgi:hypothetical protein